MTENFKERAATAFTDPIETENLIIRPWQKGDASTLAALFNRDKHMFDVWNRYNTIAPSPLDETRIRKEVFPAMEATVTEHPISELFVFRRDTGTATGFLEFSQDEKGRNFIAYHFEKKADFTVLARESGQAAIRRGIQRGFLTGELNAHTRHYNYEVRKFLRDAGFRDRGVEKVDGMPLLRFTLDTKTYMLPPPGA